MIVRDKFDSDGVFSGVRSVRDIDSLIDSGSVGGREDYFDYAPKTDRIFHDEDFISFVSNSYSRYWYIAWRDRVARRVDGFIKDMCSGVDMDFACANNDLRYNDIGMLVRMKVFTDEEVDCWNLREVERNTPF